MLGERLRGKTETWRHEGAKSVAEFALSALGRSRTGNRLLQRYGGEGTQLTDERQFATVADIDFKGRVMVGAGWDKKGRAVHGLRGLGFSGVEVGTVTAMPQPGNPKPRLWTIDDAHSVAINALGFNSPGAPEVAVRLAAAQLDPGFPVGINLGLNKTMPHDRAPEAHAYVADMLYPYASYFALGVSSPNTPGLRSLQARQPLTDIVKAVTWSFDERDPVPIFIKIAPDLSMAELDDIIGVALDTGCTGIIATNTTTNPSVKASYGARWANQPGGLSGADETFTNMSTGIIRYIYEQAGDRLDIIGAGGVHDLPTMLEKLMAGARLTQVVTAIRPSYGRVASTINSTLSAWLDHEKVKHVDDIVGAGTICGVRSA